ncbi:MAG: hypothetical protein IKY98_00300 [Alphaproteobacteria bacterium]|nr:hypothetical protein [Alphaproteobacteria bacterium]
MIKTTRIFSYLTAFLMMTTVTVLPMSASAAPSFDFANLASRIKEGVKISQRLKEQEKIIRQQVQALGSMVSEGELTTPMSPPSTASLTSLEEWAPVVPENVAEKLEKAETEEPDLEAVQDEVEKVVYLNTESAKTMRLSRNQQNVLLLNALSYAYASANRSLMLSEKSIEENQKIYEEIKNTTTEFGLLSKVAMLQLYSARKMSELLHLQSRQLEVRSTSALINRTKPVDTSDVQLDGGTSASQTSASTTTE